LLTNHLRGENVLVEEGVYLFVGDVDAQLLVRVRRKILESENVENADRETSADKTRRINVSFRIN